MKLKILFLLILLVPGFLFVQHLAQAQALTSPNLSSDLFSTAGATNCTTSGTTVYCPLAPLNDADASGIQTSGGSALADYVNDLYNIAIAVAGVLAVIMITLGGIEYMASDSPFSKSDGKDKIWNAIIGIILLFSCYLILHTINPNLLKISITVPTAGSTSAGAGGVSTGTGGSTVGGPGLAGAAATTAAAQSTLQNMASSANSTLASDQATLKQMQATNPSDPNIPVMQNKVAADQTIANNTQENYNLLYGGSSGSGSVTSGSSVNSATTQSGSTIYSTSNPAIDADGTVPPSGYIDTTRPTDANKGYNTSYTYPAGTVNTDINTGAQISTPVGPGTSLPAGTTLANNVILSNGQIYSAGTTDANGNPISGTTITAGTALPSAAVVALPATLASGQQQATGVVIPAGEPLPGGISLDATTVPFIVVPLNPDGTPSQPLGSIVHEVNNSITNPDGSHPATNAYVGDTGPAYGEQSLAAGLALKITSGTKDAANNDSVSILTGALPLVASANTSGSYGTIVDENENDITLAETGLSADEAALAEAQANSSTDSNPFDVATLTAKVADDQAVVSTLQGTSQLATADSTVIQDQINLITDQNTGASADTIAAATAQLNSDNATAGSLVSSNLLNFSNNQAQVAQGSIAAMEGGPNPTDFALPTLTADQAAYEAQAAQATQDQADFDYEYQLEELDLYGDTDPTDINDDGSGNGGAQIITGSNNEDNNDDDTGDDGDDDGGTGSGSSDGGWDSLTGAGTIIS